MMVVPYGKNDSTNLQFTLNVLQFDYCKNKKYISYTNGYELGCCELTLQNTMTCTAYAYMFGYNNSTPLLNKQCKSNLIYIPVSIPIDCQKTMTLKFNKEPPYDNTSTFKIIDCVPA